MRRFLCLLLLAALLAGAAPCAPGEELTEKQLLTYYDGCAIVGDSITRQLRVYVLEKQKTDPDYMKNARFFVAQSYFLYTASRKNLRKDDNNLIYQGRPTPLCEIIRQMRPRRVLILLGVNDYIGEEIDKGIGYCERIIDLAAEASPETEIIFESLTPVTPAFCRKKDYRTMWDRYNEALKEMCERRGAGYIDIATPLKDEEGYLRADYSSDGKYHLKGVGLQLWLDVLADYARQQYEAGNWSPEE